MGSGDQLGCGLFVSHFDHLTEGGMRVHFSGQLAHALAAGNGIGHFLNQISGMEAVDVGAQYLTWFC